MYNILLEFTCKECGAICGTIYNGFCVRCYSELMRADEYVDYREEEET